jgi:hypothetical protein
MPNHTDNILTIVGEHKIKFLLKPFLSKNNPPNQSQDDLFLDFNKIVPMPKEILHSLKYGDMKYLMMKRNPQQEKRMQDRQKKHENLCMELHGVEGWYDWSIKNWGTKWNSYDNRFGIKDTEPQMGDEILYFQTAWSPPDPVMRELSKRIGKILRLVSRDEGYAFFAITHFYPDGGMDEEIYDDHKRVPESLCRELGINTSEEDRLEQEEQEQQEQEQMAGAKNN